MDHFSLCRPSSVEAVLFCPLLIDHAKAKVNGASSYHTVGSEGYLFYFIEKRPIPLFYHENKGGKALMYFFSWSVVVTRQLSDREFNENPERSVSVWPGLSIKCPYFFEEVTYWFERNFSLSPRPHHKLTSGQEESGRERKKMRAVLSTCNLISDIKNTFCQHQELDK